MKMGGLMEDKKEPSQYEKWNDNFWDTSGQILMGIFIFFVLWIAFTGLIHLFGLYGFGFKQWIREFIISFWEWLKSIESTTWIGIIIICQLSSIKGECSFNRDIVMQIAHLRDELAENGDYKILFRND